VEFPFENIKEPGLHRGVAKVAKTILFDAQKQLHGLASKFWHTILHAKLSMPNGWHAISGLNISMPTF